jgi:hypothetical protein
MANSQSANIPLGYYYSSGGYTEERPISLVKRALAQAYGEPMRDLYDRLYHKRDYAYTLE